MEKPMGICWKWCIYEMSVYFIAYLEFWWTYIHFFNHKKSYGRIFKDLKTCSLNHMIKWNGLQSTLSYNLNLGGRKDVYMNNKNMGLLFTKMLGAVIYGWFKKYSSICLPTEPIGLTYCSFEIKGRKVISDYFDLEHFSVWASRGRPQH